MLGAPSKNTRNCLHLHCDDGVPAPALPAVRFAPSPFPPTRFTDVCWRGNCSRHNVKVRAKKKARQTVFGLCVGSRTTPLTSNAHKALRGSILAAKARISIRDFNQAHLGAGHDPLVTDNQPTGRLVPARAFVLALRRRIERRCPLS